MGVKWIKIVTDIFDDEKILLIESLPDADSIIVIWFKLLCLAGKQNNSGVFRDVKQNCLYRQNAGNNLQKKRNYRSTGTKNI